MTGKILSYEENKTETVRHKDNMTKQRDLKTTGHRKQYIKTTRQQKTKTINHKDNSTGILGILTKNQKDMKTIGHIFEYHQFKLFTKLEDV